MRRLFSRVLTFAKQPSSRQGLVIEAAVNLARARILVWRRGQHDAINGIAQPGKAGGDASVPGHDDVAREVQWAIARIEPWLRRRRHACLVQAIAASRMLSRRGIPWSLKVGVGRDTDALTAHAWLLCGERVVTGRRGMDKVTPLATYESPADLTRSAHRQ